MPLMQFVGNLGYVAVTILGGYLAIKKTIEVGQDPVILTVQETSANRSHS